METRGSSSQFTDASMRHRRPSTVSDSAACKSFRPELPRMSSEPWVSWTRESREIMNRASLVGRMSDGHIGGGALSAGAALPAVGGSGAGPDGRGEAAPW